MNYSPYISAYNPQASIDRINTQIAELEKMKSQIPPIPNQPAINQTFQLANNGSGMKFANNIDEVKKEIVIVDTPYFSKDMSILWVKTPQNQVKAYEVKEIVEKDEKDLKIEFLMAQIDELKKGVKDEPSNANVDEPIESKKSTNLSTVRTNKKK